MQFAAIGIMTLMEEYAKVKRAINYEKDVRLISYDAQVNAPDVTMRRLRNGNYLRRT